MKVTDSDICERCEVGPWRGMRLRNQVPRYVYCALREMFGHHRG